MPVSILARPRGEGRDRVRRGLVAGWIVVALAAVVAVFFGLRAIEDPDRFDIEVSNPSVYEISVSVSDGSGGGTLALVTLGPGETRSAADVIDQGDVWVFAFRSRGTDGGEVRLSRADLSEAGWQIVIPDEVVARLETHGANPAPQ